MAMLARLAQAPGAVAAPKRAARAHRARGTANK
jgi:hypothetical protein